MAEERKAPASRSAVVKKLKATKAASVYQKEWFFSMKERVEREGCDFAILNADVPMEIFRAMEALRGLTLQAPVMTGDVVYRDVCGTGASWKATKDMS